MQTIHDSTSRRWLTWALRIVVLLLLLAFAGFLVVLWWAAPVFVTDVVALKDVCIDGTPVGEAPLTLVAGRHYNFSCTAYPKREKFVVVDSGNESYIAPVPFIPQSQHDVPKDRFDPTFELAFASKLLQGRAFGFGFPTRVKASDDGESALIQKAIQTPTHTGTYELHLLWSHNPDGWVQVAPNIWRPKNNKNRDILWRRTVKIVRVK